MAGEIQQGRFDAARENPAEKNKPSAEYEAVEGLREKGVPMHRLSQDRRAVFANVLIMTGGGVLAKIAALPFADGDRSRELEPKIWVSGLSRVSWFLGMVFSGQLSRTLKSVRVSGLSGSGVAR
jgi:hypothetical protein